MHDFPILKNGFVMPVELSTEESRRLVALAIPGEENPDRLFPRFEGVNVSIGTTTPASEGIKKIDDTLSCYSFFWLVDYN